MGLKKQIINVIIIGLIGLTFSGCSTEPSAETIAKSFKSKKEKQIIKIINECNNNTFDIIKKEFTSLSKSKNYNDYLLMDSIVKKVKNNDLKKSLNEIDKKSDSNRLMAFTTGKWKRRDLTDADGIVMDVSWNNNSGTGIITDISDANTEKTDFKINDLKWNNTTFVNQNTFKFEDLSKNEDGGTYINSLATIDYDLEIIKVHVSEAGKEDYSKGDNQVWVRESTTGEIEKLKASDNFYYSKEKGKQQKKIKLFDNSGKISYAFSNDFIKDKAIVHKLEKMYGKDPDMYLARNHLMIGKAKRKDIVKSYGSGSILYQINTIDPIYKLFKDPLENDHEDNLEIKLKGLKNVIKESNYSVVYKQNNDRFMDLYFDSNNTLMCVIGTKMNFYDFQKEYN